MRKRQAETIPEKKNEKSFFLFFSYTASTNCSFFFYSCYMRASCCLAVKHKQSEQCFSARVNARNNADERKCSAAHNSERRYKHYTAAHRQTDCFFCPAASPSYSAYACAEYSYT